MTKKKTSSAPAKSSPPSSESAKKSAPAGTRRDGSGHINPAHAERLREIGNETKGVEPNAFVEGKESDDALAQELGEEAVLSMTTGQDELAEDRDEATEEEAGGPFLEVSGAQEFAGGTDESNIDDATREPFPTT
jgi:hypothetical protein